MKDFCENKKLKPEYKILEVLELTKGSYGHDKFKEFFV